MAMAVAGRRARTGLQQARLNEEQGQRRIHSKPRRASRCKARDFTAQWVGGIWRRLCHGWHRLIRRLAGVGGESFSHSGSKQLAKGQRCGGLAASHLRW